MQIIEVEQNTPEWFEARKGKITGSKLKDIVVKRGTKKKIGFYQLIADRLAIEEEGDEEARDRGHRLEDEAVELVSAMFPKGSVIKNCGIWVSEDNENIAVSPDAAIKVKGKFTQAIEVKCLKAALHIQAIVEKKIPDEYELQVLQYFIVNEDLKSLYFVFFDPRVVAKPFHYIVVERKDVQADIDYYKEYQLKELEEVERIVAELAF